MGKKNKVITCKKGKGKITNGKCSIRSKNGTCPKQGHPCKRQ